jgi:hypothetical protein
VRNGAASDNLRRIAINVFPMRYFKVIINSEITQLHLSITQYLLF